MRMTATHSSLRSSAPRMAPTVAPHTTTSRILTAPSTWISITRKTTFRATPLLDGKIFVYYWNGLSYAFFCKRPEAGKPIEVRVGDEWKTLESSAHIQIDSTGKFLQQYYTYVPRGEEGERLPLDFYPSPKADPAKKITLRQDSFGRGFFIRDVQGEWMKIQGIDYNALPDREGVIEEEEWAKVSKASEVNPSYWIHWREGRKILIYPNEFVHKYSV